MAITPGPWQWVRVDQNTVILEGQPNEWNDKMVIALREDLAGFPYVTETPNAHLIAAAPELESTLSLFLRTYWDGCRHGFTKNWQESMEIVAEQARQLFKGLYEADRKAESE